MFPDIYQMSLSSSELYARFSPSYLIFPDAVVNDSDF